MFVEMKTEVDLGSLMNRKRYIVRGGVRLDVRDDVAFRLVAAGHARAMNPIEIMAFRSGVSRYEAPFLAPATSLAVESDTQPADAGENEEA